VPDRQLDPYFAEFLPVKEGRMPRAHQHVAASFCICSRLAGCAAWEATYHIEAGDAIYFDANTTHNYACTGKAPATAVIVTLQHPLLAQLGALRGRPRQTGGRGECRQRCCPSACSEEKLRANAVAAPSATASFTASKAAPSSNLFATS